MHQTHKFIWLDAVLRQQGALSTDGEQTASSEHAKRRQGDQPVWLIADTDTVFQCSAAELR
eukprot:7381075-Prymnesium_polylepis.1